MYKNLILTICNNSYSEVLSETIVGFQRYCTKIEADLQIMYGGDLMVDKYLAISGVNTSYEKIAFIDCDMLLGESAPNLFEIEIEDVAFVPTGGTKYRNSLFNELKPIFGEKLDEKYYVYAGVMVGYTEHMLRISKDFIELWNNTVKTNGYMLNDEVYLCQIIKQSYPNFVNLEEDWLKTITKVLKGEEAYFCHPYVQGAKNKINLIKEAKKVFV